MIVGLVKVLLVNVCEPVNVATVLSIATAVPATVIPVPAVTTVIAALPSKLTPWIARAVANVVAVLALPVKAPVKPVDVTLVKPAKVVEVAPNAVDVEPIVTVLLLKELLGILPKLIAPVVLL